MELYLHVGKNVIIKKENIIGIFDYKEMKENKISSKFLENIEIINTSEGIEKAIILTKEKNKIKAYISNISSTTLLKRNNINT